MSRILTASDFPKDETEMRYMLSQKLKNCFYEIIKTQPNEWAVHYAKQGMEVDWRDDAHLKLHAQKVLTNLKFVHSLALLRTKQLMADIIDEYTKILARPYGS